MIVNKTKHLTVLLGEVFLQLPPNNSENLTQISKKHKGIVSNTQRPYPWPVISLPCSKGSNGSVSQLVPSDVGVSHKWAHSYKILGNTVQVK